MITASGRGDFNISFVKKSLYGDITSVIRLVDEAVKTEKESLTCYIQ